ncbi:M48 family metallopeptidase [Longimicrobium terrae]|uniref:Putative Zn-dependent protease n=1 Tax=Longimicrobium terrae TaxID=1639882 RepID=A0A841H1Z1_9BACT|nr:M48 family metallopeptidase [Longimicrobium terrae]MBB4637616.1 putative Zn-dependent protease [Longimicrobium terrae]MBB6072013.1 putative Zn-dependent protease [Longimicrobium terrae]
MSLALTRRVRQTAMVVCLCGAGGAAAACAPAVTTQQEVQLGADYSRQINQQLPLINDQATLQYVNNLGRRIAAVADPRGIPYNFYVVNSDVVNAFAIPGGHIYVNRGLIERSTNEAQLAGVLSHEIGHVVQRHSITQMQRAQNANTAIGVVYGVLLGRNPGGLEQAAVQVGGNAIFAGYTRDAEREADAVGVGYMVRAGYNPQGIVQLFQTLQSMQQRQPSSVEQWFATHPSEQERVANTQALIARTAGATASNLILDRQSFQTFRSRVQSLRPAPSDRR